MAMELPVEPASLKNLAGKSLKRVLDLYKPIHGYVLSDHQSKKIRISYKLEFEYGGGVANKRLIDHHHHDQHLQDPNFVKQSERLESTKNGFSSSMPLIQDSAKNHQPEELEEELTEKELRPAKRCRFASTCEFIEKERSPETRVMSSDVAAAAVGVARSSFEVMEGIGSKWPRPVWHAPWKMYRVISGHQGCVSSIAFDPSNAWFCTGSADRTIKIWDVGTGRLKLTLTGHIGQVRGLAVSKQHPYMYSAGDDKQIKCWDLEQNKVVRTYHGHLSGVYCLALHPTIDNILFTGGRDSVCRVWDIRTRAHIHALSGHSDTVCSVLGRGTDPQVATGSHDTTIKLWDLRSRRTMATLTHHKKTIRAMALHPVERNTFASASKENIKKFSLPKGQFMHNMLSCQESIVNAMSVNDDGVMATGGDNGSLWFWDWKSGHNFQQCQTIVQPGSLDSEACIRALSYDITGSRLVTCEADKTIKMWKEDENATPESHPLNYRPPKELRRF